MYACCPSDHHSPLPCSHTKSVAFTIFPENFITFNFSKFYWQHDQWPLHHPDHHILYNLHSDKEQGVEECRKRTKFFFTNILLDIEVLARRSRFVLHLLHCCWKCINRKLYNFLIGKFSFRDWLTLLEEMLKKGRLNFLYYHCIVV